MLYRTLGKSGLKVSEIGFGCGAVGGLMTGEDWDAQLRVIERALECGITHFDTAMSYGDGRSETNLGRVLKETGAEVTLSTKVRIGPERPDDLRETTIALAERSLERLGRDSVDVIQLHDPVAPNGEWPQFSLTPEDVLGPGGVVEGFKALRERGMARFFGFTGLGDPRSLHTLVESGEFHTLQVYYNLLNPTAAYPAPEGFPALDYGLILEKAAERGMGAFAIRVLARGSLTESPKGGGGKDPRTLSPGSDYSRDIERARKLDWLAEGPIRTLTQAAFQFALMRPEFSTVLAGCASISEAAAAAACSGAPEISEEALARLRELWASDFA